MLHANGEVEGPPRSAQQAPPAHTAFQRRGADTQADYGPATIVSRHRVDVCRINGVKVIPTNIPSGSMKRLTVWPQGSLLLLTSIR
jgi:hypothetical protein